MLNNREYQEYRKRIRFPLIFALFMSKWMDKRKKWVLMKNEQKITGKGRSLKRQIRTSEQLGIILTK